MTAVKNEMEFTEDQQYIFDSYLEGNNIFITGPGGCGKSHIVKAIVKHAKESGKKINVCALTGCAAVLLGCGAKTLHSWAGIGLAKGEDHQIITNISMNKYKKKNWTSTKVLIVDEVSMMSKRLFNLLDAIGKNIRKSAKPFGGIQVIFSGDFYQLPPVGNMNDPDTEKFCFESEHWEETFDCQVMLDKVFRQTNEDYIKVLHQVREGRLYKKGYELLKSRVIKDEDNLPTDISNNPMNCDNIENINIKPVILHPTKRSVNQINNGHMSQLDTECIHYKYEVGMVELPDEITMRTNYKPPSKAQIEAETKYLLANSLFEPELDLKIGSQVMCIANIDMDIGICNGSTGVIIGFKSGWPYVKLQNGLKYLFSPHCWNSENIPICIKQVPLILAWAVTIHKSQGATLEKAQMNLGTSVFTYGQSYVALSRVKSLEGVFLTSFNPQKIKADPKVMEFYTRFYESDDEDEEDNDNEDATEESEQTTNEPLNLSQYEYKQSEPDNNTSTTDVPEAKTADVDNPTEEPS